MMSLIYRQTDLGSPIDKDRVDYTVFSGKWAMGRLHQFREGAEPLSWSWTLYGILGKPLGLRSDGRARRPLRRKSAIRGKLATMA